MPDCKEREVYPCALGVCIQIGTCTLCVPPKAVSRKVCSCFEAGCWVSLTCLPIAQGKGDCQARTVSVSFLQCMNLSALPGLPVLGLSSGSGHLHGGLRKEDLLQQERTDKWGRKKIYKHIKFLSI